MSQLDVLRESLGQCDEILLDALLMRNRIVEDIMVYKEANDILILQPEQEAKQKEWLARRMEGKRHKNEVDAVFEEITRNSKKIQARKLFDYNIVLIGFMGAGKSTISDFLRTVLPWKLLRWIRSSRRERECPSPISSRPMEKNTSAIWRQNC